MRRNRIIAGVAGFALLAGAVLYFAGYFSDRLIFVLFSADGATIEQKLIRRQDSLASILPLVEREATKLDFEKDPKAALYWGIAKFRGPSPTIANRAEFEEFLDSGAVIERYSPNRISYREKMYYVEHYHNAMWLQNSTQRYKQYIGIHILYTIHSNKKLTEKGSGRRILSSVEWNDLLEGSKKLSQKMFED